MEGIPGVEQLTERTADPLCDYVEQQRRMRSNTPIISGKKAALLISICFVVFFAFWSVVK